MWFLAPMDSLSEAKLNRVLHVSWKYIQFDITYDFRLILEKGFKKSVQIQETSASVEEECATSHLGTGHEH